MALQGKTHSDLGSLALDVFGLPLMRDKQLGICDGSWHIYKSVLKSELA